MRELFFKLVATIVTIVGKLGYGGIIVMMFLESSFFPFPSEIVIPPAAYLAERGEMNIFIVVLCGILGSILGALFNYWLALKLGRPTLLRYGRYVGITPESFDKTENFLQKHGIFGTFIGRLIPVIRQYISFPAGLARLPLIPFIFATALGSGIWVIILAAIGYLVGNNQEMIVHYSHKTFYFLLPVIIIACLAYIYRQRRKNLT